MDTNTLNTAKRVKDARKEAKLTQTELGKMIGKSKQWVSELERGNIKLSFDMAVSISSACNKTTEFFCH
ncbi:MAG: helix-turn-helix domain-containing protein [Lachnospiraceae bacterium]